MYKNLNRNKKKSGFTLIEMSIVLVIIGLIVGGVLTGQDLIKAAQIRATVTQIGNYDAAVNTFRTKYNCIPGDCIRGAAFLSGGTDGDGDGLIDDGTGRFTTFTGDIENIWLHLSIAALVPGTYSKDSGANVDVGTHLPAIKLGNNGLMIYTDAGKHYYYLGIADAASSNTIATAASLAPVEAYGIDSKLDDGMPGSGTVLIYDDPGTVDGGDVGGDTTSTVCDISSGTATEIKNYNLGNESLLCELRIRASM